MTPRRTTHFLLKVIQLLDFSTDDFNLFNQTFTGTCEDQGEDPNDFYFHDPIHPSSRVSVIEIMFSVLDKGEGGEFYLQGPFPMVYGEKSPQVQPVSLWFAALPFVDLFYLFL